LAAITSTTTSQDASSARPSLPLRADVQRRRRELALTTRWLRELRSVSAATRPAARFTRPTEH
jgi:hypothetical protein